MNNYQLIKHRFNLQYWFFVLMAIGIFSDLMITYYGVNVRGLSEGNLVAGFILNQFGWEGLTSLAILMVFGFMYCIKISDFSKQWVKWIMGGLVAIHLYFPAQNVYTILSMG